MEAKILMPGGFRTQGLLKMKQTLALTAAGSYVRIPEQDVFFVSFSNPRSQCLAMTREKFRHRNSTANRGRECRLFIKGHKGGQYSRRYQRDGHDS